jgi:putative transposase
MMRGQAMTTLDELINESTDPREVKRALSVKMVLTGWSSSVISTLLNVSIQYVSKWKIAYELNGANSLRLGYQGSESYLNEQQRNEIVDWISSHKTLDVEAVRDHIEANYGIVYQSKQSYYDLLTDGNMSYHRSEKQNPKRDEEQVQARREEIKKKLEPYGDAIQRGEVVVLLEDECHLLWGDVCGRVWGQRNAPIEVSMTNERDRQTYYGAVNLVTHEFHLKAFPSGKGEYTVAYLRWLRELYSDKKIIILWDGASYHRDGQMKALLAEVNQGLDEQDWQLQCLLFAPNAPDQNPVEDIWLRGKNYLRKHFTQNKTFAAVKKCFFEFLDQGRFDSAKFDWYKLNPQII